MSTYRSSTKVSVGPVFVVVVVDVVGCCFVSECAVCVPCLCACGCVYIVLSHTSCTVASTWNVTVFVSVPPRELDFNEVSIEFVRRVPVHTIHTLSPTHCGTNAFTSPIHTFIHSVTGTHTHTHSETHTWVEEVCAVPSAVVSVCGCASGSASQRSDLWVWLTPRLHWNNASVWS